MISNAPTRESVRRADTIVREGLAGKDDPTVWRAAQEEERFLISQDFYLIGIREHSPGTHYGVQLVRLVDPNREALIRRIVTILEPKRYPLAAGAKSWQ